METVNPCILIIPVKTKEVTEKIEKCLKQRKK